MFHAASWTFTLLVLASARVYERCELARELLTLGIERDQISTWVCIAYHESRLDTGAQNYGSGDHGIFQISELYWCGPGKVCGLSCSDLRDEDIADDVQCALQVHEEHTRLQGDGFLAWVVYSQNCKHNSKKYIIDCDQQMKNVTVKTTSRSRKINLNNATAFVHNPNIDKLKPPYLAINSILRGQFNKVLQEANRKIVRNNWLDYKIDNIDDLNLPILNNHKNNQEIVVNTPNHIISTDNSPTSERPWNRNYIETKQFRKRIFHEDKLPPGKGYNEITKSSPSYINDVISISSKDGLSDFASTTTIVPSGVVTVTSAPPQILITPSKPSRLITTTSNPTTLTSKQEPPNTVTQIFKIKPTATPRPLINGFSRSISSPATRTTTKTVKTDATTTSKPTNIFTTSLKPTIFKKKTSNTSIQNRENDRDSRLFSDFRFTTKSLASVTTKEPENDRDSRLLSNFRFTTKSLASVTTKKPSNKITSLNETASAPHRKATTQRPILTKATQSIFDLYLNPTKSPQLRTYKFPQFNNSAYKLKIFSDGTTTPAPKFNKATGGVSSNARNYIRRQT